MNWLTYTVEQEDVSSSFVTWLQEEKPSTPVDVLQKCQRGTWLLWFVCLHSTDAAKHRVVGSLLLCLSLMPSPMEEEGDEDAVLRHIISGDRAWANRRSYRTAVQYVHQQAQELIALLSEEETRLCEHRRACVYIVWLIAHTVRWHTALSTGVNSNTKDVGLDPVYNQALMSCADIIREHCSSEHLTNSQRRTEGE